jgi:hypothetical protein
MSSNRILLELAKIPMPNYFQAVDGWRHEHGLMSLVVYKQKTSAEHYLLLEKPLVTADDYYQEALSRIALVSKSSAADDHPDAKIQYIDQHTVEVVNSKITSEQAHRLNLITDKEKLITETSKDYFHLTATLINHKLKEREGRPKIKEENVMSNDEIHALLHDDFDFMQRSNLQFFELNAKKGIESFERKLDQIMQNQNLTPLEKKQVIDNFYEHYKLKIKALTKILLERETTIIEARAFHILMHVSDNQYSLESHMQEESRFILNLLVDAANAGHRDALALVVEQQQNFIKFVKNGMTLWIKERYINAQDLFDLACDLSSSAIGVNYRADNREIAKVFSESIFDEVSAVLEADRLRTERENIEKEISAKQSEEINSGKEERLPGIPESRSEEELQISFNALIASLHIDPDASIVSTPSARTSGSESSNYLFSPLSYQASEGNPVEALDLRKGNTSPVSQEGRFAVLDIEPTDEPTPQVEPVQTQQAQVSYITRQLLIRMRMLERARDCFVETDLVCPDEFVNFPKQIVLDQLKIAARDFNHWCDHLDNETLDALFEETEIEIEDMLVQLDNSRSSRSLFRL